ncbi:MAG: hypothetical protein FWE19_02470 [Oscillospiraceae bacterium]|nr:hypothetical protein [Oscillospiraceae bacterium]
MPFPILIAGVAAKAIAATVSTKVAVAAVAATAGAGATVATALYKKGKHRGKKEGYIQASKEYESKLRKQTEEFLSQCEVFESQRGEYEQLINDYERIIGVLKKEVDSNDNHAANVLLRKVVKEKHELKNLSNA